MHTMLAATPRRIPRIAPQALRCSQCSSTASLSATSKRVLRRTSGSPSAITAEKALTMTCKSRYYATEANVIPKAVLIRSPPPPAPTTQGQPPESATSLHDQLDGLLHHFHESVFAGDGSCARIPDLYDQLSSNAGKVLDHELPFEDTPQEDRRVSTANPTKGAAGRLTWFDSCKLAEGKLSTEQPTRTVFEDGLVLVAHIVDAKPLPITSWSLGFIIDSKEGHQYVVSCSHTLESAMHAYNFANASSSSTFIVTRSGSLFSVNNIASSLPLYDVVLYQLNTIEGQRLHSVPVALHPPQSGVEQSLFSASEDRWRKTKVVGYKDPRGNDAEPGTYDELNSISFDVLPTPGSSGGPLISQSGAVTALIRGSRMSYGERGSVGFATPAEKIFEMFQLPGLRKRSSE